MEMEPYDPPSDAPLDASGYGQSVLDFYASLPLSIQDQSVRVLDLDFSPGLTSMDSPLSGQLRVVSLNVRPQFAALSYVWGEHNHGEYQIACHAPDSTHEYHISISMNCDAALRHLRKLHGAVSIWVDAICINQADLDEKNHQIPLMQQIYTWAQPVYVWLGPGTERSDRAIGVFLKWSQALLHFRHIQVYRIPTLLGRVKFRANFMARCSRVAFRHKLPELSKDYQAYDFRIDVDHLLDRDWIRRIWTFQEVVLSSDIELICGNQFLQWNNLLRVLMFMHHYKYPKEYGRSIPVENWVDLMHVWLSTSRPLRWADSVSLSASSKSVLELIQLDEQSWIGPSTLLTIQAILIIAAICSIPVVVILAWYRSLGLFLRIYLAAADGFLFLFVSFIVWVRSERTFSYAKYRFRSSLPNGSSSWNNRALRGILHAMQERESSQPQDRSYALFGVLQNAGVPLSPPDYAKDLGTVYRDLFTDLVKWQPSYLRSIVYAGKWAENTPTWVPQCSGEHDAWLLPYFRGTNLNSATKKSKAKPLFIDSGLTLRVQGIPQATVVCSYNLFKLDVTRSSSDFISSLTHNATVFRWWLIQARGHTSFEAAYQSVSQAIYVTLYRVDVVDEALVRPEFSSWQLFFMNNEVFGAPESSDLVERLVERLLAEETVLSYFIELCNQLAGERNVFLTSTGHLGSGPEAMGQGDIVGLISGVGVPLVLHPTDETPEEHNVVGPAYVHGLMNGESWHEDWQREILLV